MKNMDIGWFQAFGFAMDAQSYYSVLNPASNEFQKE
jgi:hypothetical protein